MVVRIKVYARGMSAKKYRITLTPTQRTTLLALVSAGQAPARKLAHARILLKADESPDGPAWNDEAIVTAMEVSRPTVERVRKRFVDEGLEAALVHRPPKATRPRRLDGRQEAHLLTLACSQPPDGQHRWTIRLLADRLVELAVVDTISHETVRQVLQQNELKPWLRQQWCLPPQSQP